MGNSIAQRNITQKYFSGAFVRDILKVSMDIIKSSGEKEQFSKSKFCHSLRETGAPSDVVEEVCNRVQKEIAPGATTSHIFRLATRYLVRENTAAAARYNLKNGIAQLGPAGFLFEQFVEAMLQEIGYTTKRNQIMDGECATHEIDIFAEKDNTHYLVEAKYHNQSGIKTPLDVVMYADARLMDIANAREHEQQKHVMWVITNTKLTSSAIKYAQCRKLKVMGWDCPKGSSEGTLQEIVEGHLLYPVTALPALNRYAREQFAKYDMLLVRDLVAYSAQDLVNKFGIYGSVAQEIITQAESLVYGNKK
ncbi:MAG: restriction endonuclease [Candidatus Paceibacterota bacterium]